MEITAVVPPLTDLIVGTSPSPNGPPSPEDQKIVVFEINTNTKTHNFLSQPNVQRKESKTRKYSKIQRCVPGGSKTYNAKWEKDPILKTWIERHPNDVGKVVCSFCGSVIRAHKNDLLEHTRTKKHQKHFLEKSTPEQYNQFISELNELRKEPNPNTKKQLNSCSGSISSNSAPSPTAPDPATSSIVTTTVSPPPTITVITPRSARTKSGMIILNNNYDTFQSCVTGGRTSNEDTMLKSTSSSRETLSCNNTIVHARNQEITSIPLTSTNLALFSPIVSLNDSIPYNLYTCTKGDEESDSASCNNTTFRTYLDLSASSSAGDTDEEVLRNVICQSTHGLWPGTAETDEFIQPDSPSNLVSVILEEQQSPSSNSTITKPTLLVDSSNGLNSMLGNGINGISSNFTGLNFSNLNLLSTNTDSSNGSISATSSTNCIDLSSSSLGTNGNHPCSINNETDNCCGGEETLLLTTAPHAQPYSFTVSDVLIGIHQGHFTFLDLCSIAKAAVNQIDQCINGTLTSSNLTSHNNITSSPSIGLGSLSSGLSPHLTQPPALESSESFCIKRDRNSRKRRSQETNNLFLS